MQCTEGISRSRCPGNMRQRNRTPSASVGELTSEQVYCAGLNRQSSATSEAFVLTLHVLAPEARNLDKWHEDWAEVSPPSARPCAARLGCQSLPGGLQAQFVATALGTYCLIASTPQSLLIVHDTCLLGLYLLAPERCYLEIQPFSPKAWKMRRTTRTRTSNHRIDHHPPPSC